MDVSILGSLVSRGAASAAFASHKGDWVQLGRVAVGQIGVVSRLGDGGDVDGDGDGDGGVVSVGVSDGVYSGTPESVQLRFPRYHASRIPRQR